MLSFGKYKNESLKDVYQKDAQYLKWLHTQPWFKIKFKDLHTLTTSLLNEKHEPIQIESDTFIIYTDGACKNNGTHRRDDARGGIGVHFSQKNKKTFKDLSIQLTIENPTNNKAELMAIEKALETCIQSNIKEKIVIFTDSEYSIKCITLWYPKWLKDKKLNGKANIDILQRIDLLMKQIQVQFRHINSHTNRQDEHSIGNSIADKLAVSAI
jgi:ribonuclease HI